MGNEMKKSDLKTGYRITVKDGWAHYIVMIGADTDYFSGDIIIDNRDGTFNWLDLNDFDDEMNNLFDRKFDIVKVERPRNPYDIFYIHRGFDVIWQRDEDE